jgi:hypothetical protein
LRPLEKDREATRPNRGNKNEKINSADSFCGIRRVPWCLHRSKHDTKQTSNQPEPGSDIVTGGNQFARDYEFTGNFTDRFADRQPVDDRITRHQGQPGFADHDA